MITDKCCTYHEFVEAVNAHETKYGNQGMTIADQWVIWKAINYPQIYGQHPFPVWINLGHEIIGPFPAISADETYDSLAFLAGKPNYKLDFYIPASKEYEYWGYGKLGRDGHTSLAEARAYLKKKIQKELAKAEKRVRACKEALEGKMLNVSL